MPTDGSKRGSSKGLIAGDADLVVERRQVEPNDLAGRLHGVVEARHVHEELQGGPYKGPKRGGPDPGPDGFEASAEGGLDGNGKTSLFTRTGKIMNGRLRIDTQVFISDEFE